MSGTATSLCKITRMGMTIISAKFDFSSANYVSFLINYRELTQCQHVRAGLSTFIVICLGIVLTGDRENSNLSSSELYNIAREFR